MNTNPMTVKEYLEQAYRIDQRINTKLGLLDGLRALATNVTAQLSDMPRNPSAQPQSMENTIVKIVDMQRELDADIDTLVDIKRDIMSAIGAISSPECQLVLELRYLCYKTWEQIAEELHYSVQNIYVLHGKALNMLIVPSH